MALCRWGDLRPLSTGPCVTPAPEGTKVSEERTGTVGPGHGEVHMERVQILGQQEAPSDGCCGIVGAGNVAAATGQRAPLYHDQHWSLLSEGCWDPEWMSLAACRGGLYLPQLTLGSHRWGPHSPADHPLMPVVSLTCSQDQG